MKKEEQTIVITLCGPGDVSREIGIAEKVITEWNMTNWEATGCGLRTRHWRNSTTPDLSAGADGDRINRWSMAPTYKPSEIASAGYVDSLIR